MAVTFDHTTLLFADSVVAGRYKDRWPGFLGEPEKVVASPFDEIVWWVDDPTGPDYPQRPDIILRVENRRVPIHFT